MNIIAEYALAGLAAVGLIASAVFAALAELPPWAAYAWTVAVLLTPVAYLVARRAAVAADDAFIERIRAGQPGDGELERALSAWRDESQRDDEARR